MSELFGVRIVTDATLVERVLHARSPSRAARRMRRGHPQHYAWVPKKDAYRLPDGSLVMHPVAYYALVAEMARRAHA